MSPYCRRCNPFGLVETVETMETIKIAEILGTVKTWQEINSYHNTVMSCDKGHGTHSKSACNSKVHGKRGLFGVQLQSIARLRPSHGPITLTSPTRAPN